MYTTQHCYYKLYLLGAGLNCNIVSITKFNIDIWGHNIWCFLPFPMDEVQHNTAFPWLHQGKEIWIQKYIQNSKLTREASQRQFHFQISKWMPKEDPAVLPSSAPQWRPFGSSENTGATWGKKENKALKRTTVSFFALQTKQTTKYKPNKIYVLYVHFFCYPLETAFRKISGRETKQLCSCRRNWRGSTKLRAQNRLLPEISWQDITIWAISINRNYFKVSAGKYILYLIILGCYYSKACML